MNQPQEFRQELLSAYLDGSLSDDEIARVEEMLKSDASAAEAYEQLKSDQSLLGEAWPSDAKLDDDFSDRVWSSILAQASAEQVADARQVRLAVSKSQGNYEPRDRNRSVAQWAGGLAALAASLMLAFSLMNQEDPQPLNTGGNSLATNHNTDVNTDVTPEEVTNEPNIHDTVEPSIAEVQPNETQLVENTTPVPVPSGSEIPGATDTVVRATPTVKDASPTEAEMLAKAEKMLKDSLEQGIQLRATLLFEVALTKRGRDLNELQYALETVGIKDVEKQSLTDQAFNLMAESGAVSKVRPRSVTDGDTELLLVDGSAKQLDRFMLSLYGRGEVVKRVGFRMLLDPNITKAMDQIVTVDNDQIRHADSDVLARHLTLGENTKFTSSLDFKMIDAQDMSQFKWIPETSESGPDARATILILVRHVD